MYVGIWFPIDGGESTLQHDVEIEAISLRPPPALKIKDIEAKLSRHVTFFVDGKEEAAIDVRWLPTVPIPAYLGRKRKLRAGTLISSRVDPSGGLDGYLLVVHGTV